MRFLFEVLENKEYIGKDIAQNYVDEMQSDEASIIYWNGDLFTKAKYKNSIRAIKKGNQVYDIPQTIKNSRLENPSSIGRLRMGYRRLLPVFPYEIRVVLQILLIVPIIFTLISFEIFRILKFIIQLCKKIDVTIKNKVLRFSFKEDDVIIIDFSNIDNNMIRELNNVIGSVDSVSVVCMIHDGAINRADIQREIAENKWVKKRIEWIAQYTKGIIFGSKSLQEMIDSYCAGEGITLAQDQIVIEVGTEVTENKMGYNSDKLKAFIVPDKYIISFGDFSENSNQDVLYRAYAYLYDVRGEENVPNLIIVGGESKEKQLLDCINDDPRVASKIEVVPYCSKIIGELIENSLFVLIPDCVMGSKYILHKSFDAGKVCIVADEKSMNEDEKKLSIIVDKDDVVGWADSILNLYSKPNLVCLRDASVVSTWEKASWKNDVSILKNSINSFLAKDNYKEKEIEVKNKLYYDMTLFMNLSYAKANISGIPRTQLILARKLWNLSNDIHFFAIMNNKYVEIDSSMIDAILDENEKIDQGYKKCSEKVRTISVGKKGIDVYTLKLAVADVMSVIPDKILSKIIKIKKRENSRSDKILGIPFNKGDIVFSSGTGFTYEESLAFIEAKKDIGFYYYQLLYDFTPVITPQTHTKETNEYYASFFRWTYEASDIVFYGGEAAMKDGEKYVKKNELPNRPGKVVRFGSDIGKFEGISNITKEDIYNKYGIGDKFLLTVGSIEPRKNYETLYLAYKWWMTFRNEDELPQIIIAGYPGWKSRDFLNKVKTDETIKNRVIVCTPSDEELDYMYKNCKYTLLASQYEGWSLTVPQSMKYNKFCLASDVSPLVEIGRDFLDYVHPLDIRGWAEMMDKYYFDTKLLKEKEQRIEKEWHSITWDECAENLYKELR